jgi:hypothetical protein
VLLPVILQSRTRGHWPRILMLGAVLASLALIGCSDNRATANHDLFPGATVEEWTLAPEPDWEFGGTDLRPGYVLSGVFEGAILGGRSVVADRGSREVRFIAPHGKLLHVTGGVGSGPGRFRAIRGLSSVNDSLVVVWDAELLRATFLDGAGEVRATAAPEFQERFGGTIRFLGALSGGELVFQAGTPTQALLGAPEGERRDPVAFLLFDSSASGMLLVDEVRGPESWLWFYRSDSGIWWSVEPVILGGGTFGAVAEGDLVIGFSDSLSLHRYEAGRPPPKSVTFSWTPRRATAIELQAERHRLLDEVRRRAERNIDVTIDGVPLPERRRPAEERSVRERPNREFWPAFRDLRGDAAGRTWIARSGPSTGADIQWTVLGHDFNPIARIAIPEGYEILDIGHDAILAVTRDTLGVEAVLRHRWSVTP